MGALVPQVHLIVCMDPRVTPGPVLHCLDLLRAKSWEGETVLVCDISWQKFVNIDQPVLYLDQSLFFHRAKSSPDEIVNVDALDNFLLKLDDFEISKVTQLGELSWGRWIQAYIQGMGVEQIDNIEVTGQKISSIELVNRMSESFEINLFDTVKSIRKNQSVIIEPYISSELSPFASGLKKDTTIPSWVQFVVKDEDRKKFEQMGFSDQVISYTELDSQSVNQPILVFDEDSILAQTSRAYPVAYFSENKIKNAKSAYIPGDIVISTEEDMHWVELCNILSYWKEGRLKELGFVWTELGAEVYVVEDFHHHVRLKSLRSYASDLFLCQNILQGYSRFDKKPTNYQIAELGRNLLPIVENDRYAMSFSIKLLTMITERMMVSAANRERLFQRLGSDYQRIVIGENLIEGIIEKYSDDLENIDIENKLRDFHRFLIKIDFYNDQNTNENIFEES